MKWFFIFYKRTDKWFGTVIGEIAWWGALHTHNIYRIKKSSSFLQTIMCANTTKHKTVGWMAIIPRICVDIASAEHTLSYRFARDVNHAAGKLRNRIDCCERHQIIHRWREKVAASRKIPHQCSYAQCKNERIAISLNRDGTNERTASWGQCWPL